MIKRIKAIVAREKLQQPHVSGFVLLVSRVFFVMRKKIAGLIMIMKKDSTFVSNDEMFMCSLFPKKVIDLVLGEVKPQSILDVGCGTGRSLAYFIESNIDAVGIENSATAISISPVKNKILRHNLNREVNLKRVFDLVWCFEVIEHIHPKYEKNFLHTLTIHAPVIVLSAARPGQGGHGHFNEQEPAYWIAKFSALGFSLDQLLTDKLRSTGETHAENLLCFKRIN